MTEGLAGTGSLLRLALRRDRVMLPLWVALFVVMASFSADATVGLYPDSASRVQAAETINGTPSLVALYGRIYDVTSLGAIAMIKMGGVGSALLAVLAFMLVIRHTRAEEELGRLELLAGEWSGPTPRSPPPWRVRPAPHWRRACSPRRR